MIPEVAAPPSSFVALEERTIGGYRLERRLGRGGMGEVWLGRHQQSRGLAAIKMIQPVAVRRAVGSYLSTEKRAIARMCHPHIVALYDAGDDYMICQYVDGTDLARRLRSPLEAAEAVRITLQVASALTHAHALGVIHRDVKPGNILVDHDGNAYLADFGVARIVDDLEPDERVVGTPAFMAPEQREGRATEASDQYGLGRTLLVMLAGGRAPVDPAEALAALPATLSSSLRGLVARATDPDPAARFPSVRAFADALAAVALDDFPTAVPLAPLQRSPAPFAWCKKARRVEALGYDIQRADYRLSELGFPDADTAALSALSGFEELGFAVFAGARLGPIDDPGAFARATEVIVLMHGLYGTRDTWRFVSATCCRANGQAIVIAPDLFGFGESRYAGGAPRPEHVRPETLPRLMLALQSLLGLAGLPTIWVAHSAAATSILAVDDDEVPMHVHRVAITPYYPSGNPIARAGMQLMLFVMRALCWVDPLHRWMARAWAYNAKTAVYSSEERDRMRDLFAAATAEHNHRLLATYGATRPRGGSTLARTMIILVEDDPLSPAAVLTRRLQREGFPDDKIFRLARGSHLPHSLEDFAARNINDIAAVIDTVLDSTRGATASTHAEPRRTITWVS